MPPEQLVPWARRIARNTQGVREELDHELKTWAKEAERKIRARAPVDRGDLRRSISVEAQTFPERSIEIESEDPAAVVFEEGGPLQGRPWLAVPLRDEIRQFKTPRLDVDLFSLQTPDGRVFLATRRGGALDIRWRLARRVRRRPRPFIQPTAIEEASDLPRRLLDAIDDQIRRRR